MVRSLGITPAVCRREGIRYPREPQAGSRQRASGTSMSTRPPSPELNDICEELDQALGATGPLTAREHAEQLTVVSALVCSAFRRVGLWAVLVGGGVIEVHAPGAYTTFDIDLVISRHGVAPRRDELDDVFRALGFAKQAARHWTRGEVLIEVPGWEVDDPTEELRIGPHVLEMVCKEAVLVGRLVEYEQTGHTGHAAQAILMLRVLGEALNRERLDQLVAREHVEDAYAAAREIASWPPERHITNRVLQEARDRWQARRRQQAADPGRPKRGRTP
jgi:hypothetical protein